MKTIDSAGGVILNELKEVVIVYTNTKSWQFPKGTVEKDEKFIDTALREIKEETGLSDLKLIKRLPSYSRVSTHENNTIRNIHYFLFTTNKTSLTPDAEITDCKWTPINEADNLLTYPEDKQFIIEQRPEILKILSRQR
jgi:8-oxo-dGTP pyrophosphatase MutT (NUDIX family)